MAVSTKFQVQKQPWEILKGVGIDFVARLATGEVLDSGETQEVVADINGVPVAGIVSEVQISAVTSTVLLCTVSAGINGQKIRLTYKAIGTLGNHLEGEVWIKVKET